MKSSLAKLVAETVDYAGLFPPAALPITDVVRNYSTYLENDPQNMLARLIIPTGKLDQLLESRDELKSKKPWQISALCPPIGTDETSNESALTRSLETIVAFNEKCGEDVATIDAIEVKSLSAEQIQPTMDAVPEDLNVFIEVPWQSDIEEWISSIARGKGEKQIFAKIRTGGVTPDLIPPTERVAKFIATCAKHDVGFKATAGLHHPLRADFRLTYKDDAPIGTMHGFLNVFVASLLAFEHRPSVDIIDSILNVQSVDDFSFSDDELKWSDLSVSTQKVEEFRNQRIVSFGSCSFTEPTEELKQILASTHSS